MNTDDRILIGVAQILWGLSWADHADEHGCVNLSGKKIEHEMPEIPDEAWLMSARLVGMIEQANERSVYCLYADAVRADTGQDEHVDFDSDDAERFGNCLAYQALGHGVSWFDDHAEFPLETPSFEATDLRVLADEQCDLPGDPIDQE